MPGFQPNIAKALKSGKALVSGNTAKPAPASKPLSDADIAAKAALKAAAKATKAAYLDAQAAEQSTPVAKRKYTRKAPADVEAPAKRKYVKKTKPLDTPAAQDTAQPEYQDDDDEVSEVTSLAVRKARAQTADIEWKALQSELTYKKDSGEYLSRAAFREASATLLAEVAQGLRSLPDLLERKCALSPDALVKAEQTIDDCLSSLAAGLSQFVAQDE